MLIKSDKTVGIGHHFEGFGAVFAAIALLFLSHANKAQNGTLSQTSDEHVQSVIASLEPDNTLRIALERGDRGSGVHSSWMDMMRRFGVKQASYQIRFVWSPAYRRLSIQNTAYLMHYYRFDSKISEKSSLRRISQSGLEKALTGEIRLRARQNLKQRTHDMGATWLCGVLYLNLLDDEVLPILDEPAHVYGENKSDCRRYR